MTVDQKLAEAIDAELDEHGYEDDDEKRGQVAHHFAVVALDALRDAGYEIVRVPDGMRVGVHADRDGQIQLLNAAECKGFQWIGQTWDSCGGCGGPYWYHTHIERAKRDAGPFDDGPPEYEPISEKSKQRMKRFYADPANKGRVPSPLRAT